MAPAGIGRRKHEMLRSALLDLAGPAGVAWLREFVVGRPPSDSSPAARALVALMAEIGRGFRPRTEPIPLLSDAALRRLIMPLLAIVGGRDETINSAETRRRLALNTPKAEVRFLPAAGHSIPGQTETIVRFLRG